MRVTVRLDVDGNVVLIILPLARVIMMAFATAHFVVRQCLIGVRVTAAPPKFTTPYLSLLSVEVLHEPA